MDLCTCYESRPFAAGLHFHVGRVQHPVFSFGSVVMYTIPLDAPVTRSTTLFITINEWERCVLAMCTIRLVVDEEDEEEITVSEALQQALKTRSKGILKHISCLSTDAYSDAKELRVWASTFNVNGEKPQPEYDFRSWLLHPGEIAVHVVQSHCSQLFRL
jgi:hypothetical protein